MRKNLRRHGLVTMLMGLALASALVPTVALAETSRDGITANTIIDAGENTWNTRKITDGDTYITVKSGATLNIPYGIYVKNGDELHINGGGKVIVGEALRGSEDYSGCAGLGGDNGDASYGSTHQDGGSIYIEGETTVYAYGAPHAAAIGGGMVEGVGGSPLNVVISDGSTVAAYGGTGAAGIGGAEGASATNSGKIAIMDAHVTAFGGCAYDNGFNIVEYTAPGIGSGNGGDNFYGISLNNSKVLVEAEGNAAALGGGEDCNKGLVTIADCGLIAKGNGIGIAPNTQAEDSSAVVELDYSNGVDTENVYVSSKEYHGDTRLLRTFVNTEIEGGRRVNIGNYGDYDESPVRGTLVPLNQKCSLAAYSIDSELTNSVADVTIYPGLDSNRESYYVDDSITATAPDVEGYTFAGWYKVTDVDGNGKVTAYGDQLSDQSTYKFTLDGDTSIVAVYNKKVPQPSFKSMGLTVGSQIGLDFALDLPKTESRDYANAHMNFFIKGKAARSEDVRFANARYDEKTGLYHFTFNVTSVEMAETVTAGFHYMDGNEEKVISAFYSVQDYFNDFDEVAEKNPAAYPEKTVNLVHATADLGYYMQPYLAGKNGWKIGTDYAEITKFYGEMDLGKAADGLKDYGIKAELGDSGVAASASASFDSLTAVNVFLSAPDDPNFSAKATFGGKTYDAEKLSDGRWLVRVEGVRPQLLNETVAVAGTCDGKDFTVDVSVLGLLNAGFPKADDEAKAAFASVYFDCQAAKAYIG